jgi:hypothetical protein
MVARLAFIGIAAFWVTMNVLLWRAEFGIYGGDTAVPPPLVWHKILTAPDASSMSVYQRGERMGFCEITTGVAQQMAQYDQDTPPPEGLSGRGGYQIEVTGNIAMGDFTNRLKFDVHAWFDAAQQWRQATLKVSIAHAALEIRSVATNATAHVRLLSDGAVFLDREVPFSELQNPGALLRELGGNLGGDAWGLFDVPGLVPTAQKIEWDARRTRVKMGAEPVPIYLVRTSLLGHDVTFYISTLGEFLRVELPDDISARIDDWNK